MALARLLHGRVQPQSREELVDHSETAAKSEELPMVFYMFTDVKNQVTEMLFLRRAIMCRAR